MPDFELYASTLTAAQPDGSCFTRIGYLTADDDIGDPDDDLDMLDQPELMLTTARPFLEALLLAMVNAGFSMVLQISPPWTEPWVWPPACVTPADVARMMESLSALTGKPESEYPYPIQISCAPHAQWEPAHRLVEQFRRDHPGTESQWNALIRAGIIRINLSELTCSIASRCDAAPTVRAWVTGALRHAGLAAHFDRDW